ncbi:MAG: hypothetical protein ACKO37_00175, partial [Vampirovibrionales bacterium]
MVLPSFKPASVPPIFRSLRGNTAHGTPACLNPSETPCTVTVSPHSPHDVVAFTHGTQAVTQTPSTKAAFISKTPFTHFGSGVSSVPRTWIQPRLTQALRELQHTGKSFTDTVSHTVTERLHTPSAHPSPAMAWIQKLPQVPEALRVKVPLHWDLKNLEYRSHMFLSTGLVPFVR